MKLKTIPILLVLGVLLLGASPAQAAEFKAAEYTAAISGAQLGTGTGGTPGESGTILSFEGQMTECGSAGFEGQLKGSSSELDVQQLGIGCTAFGVSNATLATNGCAWRLHVGSGSVDAFAGTVDVVCPAGATMVLTGGGCEVQIGPQTGLSSVSYENLTKESPKKLGVTFNVSGMTYTKAKDNFPCPLNGTGAATDGKLVGGTKVSASVGGTGVGLWIE